ncbi:PPA1309 family protein [Rhodococcus marinonascens]|uniref:PPA1309 family protein n=1 Tax=Rhodococcus marinonascens TaxID=38311 RepID=UPI000B014CFC|nr:PPA1309 family protein [Rhodococcus marinonascens]
MRPSVPLPGCKDESVSEKNVSRETDTLARCVREVVEFVDAGEWDQPPQMFALVPTELLAAAEPSLLDQLLEGSELTPVAQDPFPDDIDGGSRALDEFLATTSWPESVVGCALVQEIVVLPPEAESDLDDALVPLLYDRDAADNAGRAAAESHPDRKSGRLIAAVLRDGPSLCVMQLRPDDDADPYAGIELLTYEDLAPNLVNALYATFDATEDD